LATFSSTATPASGHQRRSKFHDVGGNDGWKFIVKPYWRAELCDAAQRWAASSLTGARRQPRHSIVSSSSDVGQTARALNRNYVMADDIETPARSQRSQFTAIYAIQISDRHIISAQFRPRW